MDGSRNSIGTYLTQVKSMPGFYHVGWYFTEVVAHGELKTTIIEAEPEYEKPGVGAAIWSGLTQLVGKANPESPFGHIKVESREFPGSLTDRGGVPQALYVRELNRGYNFDGKMNEQWQAIADTYELAKQYAYLPVQNSDTVGYLAGQNAKLGWPYKLPTVPGGAYVVPTDGVNFGDAAKTTPDHVNVRTGLEFAPPPSSPSWYRIPGAGFPLSVHYAESGSKDRTLTEPLRKDPSNSQLDASPPVPDRLPAPEKRSSLSPDTDAGATEQSAQGGVDRARLSTDARTQADTEPQGTSSHVPYAANSGVARADVRPSMAQDQLQPLASPFEWGVYGAAAESLQPQSPLLLELMRRKSAEAATPIPNWFGAVLQNGAAAIPEAALAPSVPSSPSASSLGTLRSRPATTPPTLKAQFSPVDTASNLAPLPDRSSSFNDRFGNWIADAGVDAPLASPQQASDDNRSAPDHIVRNVTCDHERSTDPGVPCSRLARLLSPSSKPCLWCRQMVRADHLSCRPNPSLPNLKPAQTIFGRRMTRAHQASLCRIMLFRPYWEEQALPGYPTPT